MQKLNEYLQNLRKCPTAFFGTAENAYQNLVAWMIGYDCARFQYNDRCGYMDGFREYVILYFINGKTHWSPETPNTPFGEIDHPLTPLHWCNVIKKSTNSDEEAFNLFFELWDGYCERKDEFLNLYLKKE